MGTQSDGVFMQLVQLRGSIADLAGVGRLQYSPGIKVIRIPCTGGMSPKYILQAFRHVDGRGLGLRLSSRRLPLSER